MSQLPERERSLLLEAGQLVYQAEIQFVDEIDFGISMQEILSGQQAIPPGGARFDQSFEG